MRPAFAIVTATLLISGCASTCDSGCASTYDGALFTACYQDQVQSLRLFRSSEAADLPQLPRGVVPLILDQTNEYAAAEKQLRSEVASAVEDHLGEINTATYNVVYVSLRGGKWLAITPVLPVLTELVDVPRAAAFAVWRPPSIAEAIIFRLVHAKPDDCVYFFDSDARLLRQQCQEGTVYSNLGGGNLHTRFHDLIRLPRAECNVDARTSAASR